MILRMGDRIPAREGRIVDIAGHTGTAQFVPYAVAQTQIAIGQDYRAIGQVGDDAQQFGKAWGGAGDTGCDDRAGGRIIAPIARGQIEQAVAPRAGIDDTAFAQVSSQRACTRMNSRRLSCQWPERLPSWSSTSSSNMSFGADILHQQTIHRQGGLRRKPHQRSPGRRILAQFPRQQLRQSPATAASDRRRAECPTHPAGRAACPAFHPNPDRRSQPCAASTDPSAPCCPHDERKLPSRHVSSACSAATGSAGPAPDRHRRIAAPGPPPTRRQSRDGRRWNRPLGRAGPRGSVQPSARAASVGAIDCGVPTSNQRPVIGVPNRRPSASARSHRMLVENLPAGASRSRRWDTS